MTKKEPPSESGSVHAASRLASPIELERPLLALADAVRVRVEAWLRDGSVHPDYAQAWAAIFARPLAEVLPVLTDPSERCRALRHCTPFIGILDQEKRLRIRTEVRWPS